MRGRARSARRTRDDAPVLPDAVAEPPSAPGAAGGTCAGNAGSGPRGVPAGLAAGVLAVAAWLAIRRRDRTPTCRTRPARCPRRSSGPRHNKVGTTLATAKVPRAAGSPDAARRQPYLEAVAHDVYANGYRDGRQAFEPLLAAAGVSFDHWKGYDAGTVATVFGVVNGHAAKRMASRYGGAGCLSGRDARFAAQLWRTFESEAHLLPAGPGDAAVAGVYRTDLPPEALDATHGGHVPTLGLADLVAEGVRVGARLTPPPLPGCAGRPSGG
ncbi:MAG: hypothetical protein FJ087_11995 [Deltaproteobacteria bacterium]|nr:hypothetical protein [Deltaproteobacteria bacterium]